MTKLADITFEAASQTGVTLTASGSGALSARANSALAGLVGSWRYSYTVPSTSGATAWADLNLATISGSSVGLGRSIGGTFRLGSSSLHLERMGLFTLRGGASGAVLLAGVFTDLTTGNIVLRYNTNSGVQQVSVGNTLKDGSAHTFHLYYLCSPTLSTGQVTLLVDGVSVFSSTTISNSTLSFGSGVTNVYLGQYFGAVASSQIQGSGTLDGLYIGDAATAEVSSEQGAVISGNTSPVAATERTLALASTAIVQTWASSDPSVMTVSVGLVTLQQAAGGVATITDGGGGSTVVEFLPRTLTYTVGGIAYTAPTLSHSITLASVSDGYSLYPDIYPSITAPAGVTLTSVDSVGPPWVAYYTVPSSGAYSIVINGATFSVDTADAGGGGSVDPPIILPPTTSAPATAKPIVLGVTVSGELVFLF